MEPPPGRRRVAGVWGRRHGAAACSALLALWPPACSALLVAPQHGGPAEGGPGQPGDAQPPTNCLREGENALPKELEAYCLPERRRVTAAALRNVFDQKFAARVQQDIADALVRPRDSVVMVVLATATGTRAGRFFRNFMVHAQWATKTDNSPLTVAAMALDNTSMTDCEQAKAKYTKDLFHVVCTNVTGWLPKKFFSGPAEHQRRVDRGGRKSRDRDGQDKKPSADDAAPKSDKADAKADKADEADRAADKDGNVGCGSCVYNMFLWTKPTLLQAAASVLQEEQGVLMLDLDIVLYHNPLDHIRSVFPSRESSALLTARERTGKANTGAVYVTEKAGRILDRWAKHADWFLEADTGDQAALQDQLLQVDVRRRWERIPLDVLGQYGGKGKIGTHYNGYAGNKAAGMFKSGDWKPNEAAMYAAGDWVEDDSD